MLLWSVAGAVLSGNRSIYMRVELGNINDLNRDIH